MQDNITYIRSLMLTGLIFSDRDCIWDMHRVSQWQCYDPIKHRARTLKISRRDNVGVRRCIFWCFQQARLIFESRLWLAESLYPDGRFNLAQNGCRELESHEAIMILTVRRIHKVFVRQSPTLVEADFLASKRHWSTLLLFRSLRSGPTGM